MAGDKQSQKAGDYSQQFQANTVIVNQGIDEKRAREICEETFKTASRDFTADAYACAEERVKKLENSLLPKIMEIENALNVFSDPSFQFLLKSAQKTAAATEREADYDMLAELLVCRVTKGQSRKNRAGLSRAVEIIDEIDDDALCALTIAYASETFIPVCGYVNDGLQLLDNLFKKLFYLDLPTGSDWIEHLDILDAVRINSINSFKKLNDLYCERLKGYAVAGIKIESEDYNNALKILSDANLDSSLLKQNINYPDYALLPIINQNYIKDLTLVNDVNSNGTPPLFRSINANEQAALKSVWDLYTSDPEVNRISKEAFIANLDSYPALKKLRSWWDSIPVAFDITRVGAVLAHTNAKRCDNTLPELPLAT